MINTQDVWNADLYDHNHNFVSNYGNDLVDLLNPKKGEHILDLGCGTGNLANKLFEIGNYVIGIDKSNNMIQQAKKKYPHIKFFVSDAIELDYHNQFDAVFSNATLHWVKPPKQALQKIFNSLKVGGRFVAEFGGKGNVRSITDEIITQMNKLEKQANIEFPWYFPSIGEYSSLMEDVGFRVVFAQHFDRSTPLEGEDGLKNWIEMFGSGMFTGICDDSKEKIITNVENNLRNQLYNNGCWIADYKRIRVVGFKE